MERTLAIVKPDAVKRNLIGEIVRRAEQGGLRVAAARFLHLTKGEAEGFYAVHRERPFFADLTTYMSSGPVMVLVMEGRAPSNVGATSWARPIPPRPTPDDPQGSRLNVEQNSSHGSDAPETARFEISYFFSGIDVVAATESWPRAALLPSGCRRCRPFPADRPGSTPGGVGGWV